MDREPLAQRKATPVLQAGEGADEHVPREPPHAHQRPDDRREGNAGHGDAHRVRDAGREGTALVLKPHLMGRNPLAIEPILDSLRNFASQQRLGGGYSAVDMALHDISGKVFGVPAWRLVGSKYRDRIRIYCDTDQSRDPKVFAERLKKRKAMGFTFFKMDLGTSLVSQRPGAVNSRGTATVKGLEYLCEYIQAIRDEIGWEAPLATDHFGALMFARRAASATN